MTIDSAKLSKSIWVIAADQAQARLFVTPTPRAPLALIETLDNPDAHARERDLHRHGAGRRAGGHGNSTLLVPHSNGADCTNADFARVVSERIEHHRTSGELLRLHLVAPPTMLGLLRQHLPVPCMALVGAEIARDPGHDDPATLRRVLPEQL